MQLQYKDRQDARDWEYFEELRTDQDIAEEAIYSVASLCIALDVADLLSLAFAVALYTHFVCSPLSPFLQILLIAAHANCRRSKNQDTLIERRA